MNNAEDRNGQSIDELARSIVNNDPSNAAGRPGKKGSTGRFFRKPLIWVAGAVLVAVIVGIVLSLGHGSSPGGAPPSRFRRLRLPWDPAHVARQRQRRRGFRTGDRGRPSAPTEMPTA